MTTSRSIGRTLFVAGALALAARLPAQGIPGDTVRVKLRDVVLVRGILLARDSIGIDVQPLGTGDTVRVIAGELTRFQVLRGYRPGDGAGAVGRGAAVGAMVGLGLAALSLAASGGSHHNDETAGLAIIVLPVVGALVGILHGAAIGFVDDPVWVDFTIAAAISPMTGGSR